MAKEQGKRSNTGQWKPGVSGNPAGRKALTDETYEVRQLARQFTKKAINRLALLLESRNEKIVERAANSLLDRGWGKPPQAVYLNHEGGGMDEDRLPPAIKNLCKTDRIQLARLIEKARTIEETRAHQVNQALASGSEETAEPASKAKVIKIKKKK